MVTLTATSVTKSVCVSMGAQGHRYNCMGASQSPCHTHMQVTSLACSKTTGSPTPRPLLSQGMGYTVRSVELISIELISQACLFAPAVQGFNAGISLFAQFPNCVVLTRPGVQPHVLRAHDHVA